MLNTLPVSVFLCGGNTEVLNSLAVPIPCTAEQSGVELVGCVCRGFVFPFPVPGFE